MSTLLTLLCLCICVFQCVQMQMRVQLIVAYATVLLLLICAESGNALKCYWCVGIHCKHAGSEQEIDCNGSCYEMRATLDNGILHIRSKYSTPLRHE